MWKTEYRCIECKKPMSYNTMMYSHGRCPMCGYKHPRACTIVECTEHGYKDETIVSQASVRPKWWEFWKPTFQAQTKRVYREDEK
jgi:hypothetical protein